MIYTHKPKLNSTQIEERIEEDGKKIGLVLKKHFPFSKNLPENGFDIKEHASVFELCKMSMAAKLLNTQPELNVLMPCRISIYDKNGETFVSTPDMSIQLEMFDCDEDLKKEILELYEDIMTMIKIY